MDSCKVVNSELPIVNIVAHVVNSKLSIVNIVAHSPLTIDHSLFTIHYSLSHGELSIVNIAAHSH
jgi:hypothetical protein